MSTYTAISYHIVFSTRDRAPVLEPERRSEFSNFFTRSLAWAGIERPLGLGMQKKL
jgi:REP element-mobilizing transposase RayT